MTTIVDSNLPVARPSWEHSRLESRIVHLGCGAFHRAHQALYTHHLLESTDSDWGICEVNLMPGQRPRADRKPEKTATAVHRGGKKARKAPS